MYVTNYQNCDLVTAFLDELPTVNAQQSEAMSLLGVLSPYVPRTELERILNQKRHAKAVLTAPVHGERIVDNAGAVEHRTYLPGEGKKA